MRETRESGAEPRPVAVEGLDALRDGRALGGAQVIPGVDAPGAPIASNVPDGRRAARAQASASSLIAAMAILKPPLVSDEPETRRDVERVDVLPDDLVGDAAGEVRLHALRGRVGGVRGHGDVGDLVVGEGQLDRDALGAARRLVAAVGGVGAVGVALVDGVAAASGAAAGARTARSRRGRRRCRGRRRWRRVRGTTGGTWISSVSCQMLGMRRSLSSMACSAGNPESPEYTVSRAKRFTRELRSGSARGRY